MFNVYEFEKRVKCKGKKDLATQNQDRWKDKAKSRSYIRHYRFSSTER